MDVVAATNYYRRTLLARQELAKSLKELNTYLESGGIPIITGFQGINMKLGLQLLEEVDQMLQQ